MIPFDGDGKQLSIHSITGSLRSRIIDLQSGNFQITYSLKEYQENGMPYYEPYFNTGFYIHAYTPSEITNCLKPLLRILNSIKEKHLSHLKEEAEDFSDKSKYEMIADEIRFYKTQFSIILEQYSIGSEGPFYTFTYTKEKGKKRLKKLESLYKALLPEITDIDLTDIYKIFSGETKKVENPIDWQGDKNELIYFINKLTARDDICYTSRRKWETISNCLTHKGERVSIGDRDSYRIKSTVRKKEINSIIDRLN